MQVETCNKSDLLGGLDTEGAVSTLDGLMDLVSDLLPVTEKQYPQLRRYEREDEVEFCLRHSALHFMKTAGLLASWVEDADHGKYGKIDTLENIVAASLVNSLKLADEIGIDGTVILSRIQSRLRK